MAEAVASSKMTQGGTWLHVVDHNDTGGAAVSGNPEDWLPGQRESLAA